MNGVFVEFGVSETGAGSCSEFSVPSGDRFGVFDVDYTVGSVVHFEKYVVGANNFGFRIVNHTFALYDVSGQGGQYFVHLLNANVFEGRF